MNCADFEQLLDAYLDGELSGSLRLEFDAHRLRCRGCELTVASMEAVEDVITADRPVPSLSMDFTDRVMGKIEGRKSRSTRSRNLRIAIVGGAVLQAAAVLMLALLLPSSQTPPAVQVPAVPTVASAEPVLNVDSATRYAKIETRGSIHEAMVALIEGKAKAAAQFNSDFAGLAGYGVSKEFAQATEDLRDASPVQWFLEAVAPRPPDKSEPAATTTDGQIPL